MGLSVASYYTVINSLSANHVFCSKRFIQLHTRHLATFKHMIIPCVLAIQNFKSNEGQVDGSGSLVPAEDAKDSMDGEEK